MSQFAARTIGRCAKAYAEALLQAILAVRLKSRLSDVWSLRLSCNSVISLQSSVISLQSSVGSRQSAVGSRQSAVGSRQSAVDSHQSPVGVVSSQCFALTVD